LKANGFRRALSIFIALVFCIALQNPARPALASAAKYRSADWFLTATEASGLVAAPKNPGGGIDNLFDATSMAPGDALDASVTVRNQCGFPLTLSVEVRSLLFVPAGDADLVQQLVLNAYMGGAILADFPAVGAGAYDGRPSTGAYVYSAQFAPHSVTDIRFELSLPGSSTGNEYQGMKAELQWVFTATRAESGGDDNDDDDDDNGNDNSGDGGRSDSGTADIGGSPAPTGALEGGLGGSGIMPIEDVAETPLSSYTMPKTGEPSLLLPTLSGAALAITGLAMLWKGRRRSGKRLFQLPNIALCAMVALLPMAALYGSDFGWFTATAGVAGERLRTAELGMTVTYASLVGHTLQFKQFDGPDSPFAHAKDSLVSALSAAHGQAAKNEALTAWLLEHGAYISGASNDTLEANGGAIASNNFVFYEYYLQNVSNIPVYLRISSPDAHGPVVSYADSELPEVGYSLASLWRVNDGEAAGLIGGADGNLYAPLAIGPGDAVTATFIAFVPDLEPMSEVDIENSLPMFAEIIQATNNASYLHSDWADLAYILNLGQGG
jgi:hypothetical protein